MKVKKSLLALLCVCLLGNVGCSTTHSAQTSNDELQSNKLKIGLSVDSFVLERWQREKDIFVSRAEEMGAEVNVQNASGDIEKQIAQIEYLINKKMDVIAIIPIDAKAIGGVVKKAQSAGIKIIAYDRIIANANVDLYISFDSKKVGELMAENLVKTTSKDSNILMICGPLMDNNVVQITEGFEEIMNQNSQRIMNKIYIDEWLPEKAFLLTNEELKRSYSINGIMCGNDALAGQAIKALAEKRLAGQVRVVGQDADVEACQRIVEGTQSMTVYKPVDKLAKEAAEYAVMLAKGKKLNVGEMFFDGKYNVPYKRLEPTAVTRENIDKVIIESGFHLKEDVYLNMPHCN